VTNWEAGAEAFVSVEDIAAVAAVTLTEPETHAGRSYAPTGPQALTMAFDALGWPPPLR
jgi:uncharacterized protein YbjT (DUF2867 family)